MGTSHLEQGGQEYSRQQDRLLRLWGCGGTGDSFAGLGPSPVGSAAISRQMVSKWREIVDTQQEPEER